MSEFSKPKLSPEIEKASDAIFNKPLKKEILEFPVLTGQQLLDALDAIMGTKNQTMEEAVNHWGKNEDHK